jgi:hypothetical protein
LRDFFFNRHAADEIFLAVAPASQDSGKLAFFGVALTKVATRSLFAAGSHHLFPSANTIEQ